MGTKDSIKRAQTVRRGEEVEAGNLQRAKETPARVMRPALQAPYCSNSPAGMQMALPTENHLRGSDPAAHFLVSLREAKECVQSPPVHKDQPPAKSRPDPDGGSREEPCIPQGRPATPGSSCTSQNPPVS